MIFLDHPKFLVPYGTPCSSTTKFSGTDKEELFKNNLQCQDDDWYYRSTDIEYTFNSNGYRSNEWSEIDWSNSIVILGCSQVLGVGLAEDDTIIEQLSILSKKPVVNLGAGASSMFFSFYNSLILKKHFPTPWAVVHLWSGIDRLTYFDDDKTVFPLGSWAGCTDRLYRHWVKSQANIVNQAIYMPFISPIIWNNTRYYQGSFFKETSDNTGIDFIHQFDYARDFAHLGKETAYATALTIFNNLKNY